MNSNATNNKYLIIIKKCNINLSNNGLHPKSWLGVDPNRMSPDLCWAGQYGY